jgi:hypothetical protein
MVSQPDGELGQTTHRDAAEAMALAAKEAAFSATDEHHRRGDFGVLSHGTSYGGGQPVSTTLLTWLIRSLTSYVVPWKPLQ